MSAPQSPSTPPHSQWEAAQPGPGQPYAGYQAPYGYPQGYAYPPEDPGKTLGIVGFVMAFVVPVVGIILSAMGSSRSKAAGFDNQLAKWGLVLSIVFTALGFIVGVVYVVAIIAAIGAAGY